MLKLCNKTYTSISIPPSWVEHKHDRALIDVADLSVNSNISLCGGLASCVPAKEIHVREYLFDCKKYNVPDRQIM